VEWIVNVSPALDAATPAAPDRPLYFIEIASTALAAAPYYHIGYSRADDKQAACFLLRIVVTVCFVARFLRLVYRHFQINMILLHRSTRQAASLHETGRLAP